MSRAYRITVRESIVRDLTVTDEVATRLELLEILPPDATAELLADELKSRGFIEEDGKLTRSEEGIEITVDVKTSEVRVRAKRTEGLELTDEREDWGYDDIGPNEEEMKRRLTESAKQDLEKRAESRAESLREEVTNQLEAKLGDLRNELDRVVNRVTAEALKRKAASLGRIKETHEDTEAGSLTIIVEV